MFCAFRRGLGNHPARRPQTQNAPHCHWNTGLDPGRSTRQHPWSFRSVHGQFACNQRFRIRIGVTGAMRGCLAVIADTSIGGRLIARRLRALIARREKPGVIIRDGTATYPKHRIDCISDRWNVFFRPCHDGPGWRFRFEPQAERLTRFRHCGGRNGSATLPARLQGKPQDPAQESARSRAYRHVFRLPAPCHSDRLMIGSWFTFAISRATASVADSPPLTASADKTQAPALPPGPCCPAHAVRHTSVSAFSTISAPVC